MLLASVRRLAFSSDEGRVKFLARLSLGTRELMKSHPGTHDSLSQQVVATQLLTRSVLSCLALLQHPEVYHQFCRLLYRMKTNSQINGLSSFSPLLASALIYFVCWGLPLQLIAWPGACGER